MKRIAKAASLLCCISLVGCASYRTSSNIEATQSAAPQPKKIEVLATGAMPARKYQVLRRIEVSIKKLTIFHSDPTKEQANKELEKRAAPLGCDAVVNVQYQSGIGLTTWGYIDAQGDCVRYQ